MKSEEISSLATEGINPVTREIDKMTTLEMVNAFNAEDATIAKAVRDALPEIAQSIDSIVSRLHKGGRLIYMGAGTSGRLGVLDASECPPTFNVPDGMVIGLIAGGDGALRHSVEEAEDRPEYGLRDLVSIGLNANDCVVGIASSGRTPYVLGGLQYARQIGALAIGLACNKPAKLCEVSDINILIPVGPEPISGSTRMKAGTATKMVLNMISTGVMVRLGKTYGNLMVDLRPTNEKLRIRATNLVHLATNLESQRARYLLECCDWEVKTAIVMAILGCDPEEARRRLLNENGMIRKVIEKPNLQIS